MQGSFDRGWDMADGFQVDLAALQQAAQGVNGVIDEVAAQSVGDIPHGADAIGHAGLASTFSDFLSRWTRGVDNLASDGREIAARLTANVNAYTEAEQDIRRHLIDVGGELEGTGADPGVR